MRIDDLVEHISITESEVTNQDMISAIEPEAGASNLRLEHLSMNISNDCRIGLGVVLYDVEVGSFSIIQGGVTISSGTVIRPFTMIYCGVKIGKNCVIGPHVLIENDVVIGDNCKVKSHSFICEGVTLEDEVFVGHGVMFCNEKYPRAVREIPWALKDGGRVLVKKGAVIGSGAVILPGVTIGRGAIIGAGAVVTKDVGFEEIVAGSPAVSIDQIRKIYGGLMFVREHEAQIEGLRKIVDGRGR